MKLTLSYRVRGGGWFNYAERCRIARRNHSWPVLRNGNIGFRLIL
jgi:formylglycine-generating enzyme required for sulfatase activity